MHSDHDRSYVRIHKKVLLILVVALLAGILGWKLGRDTTPSKTNQVVTSPNLSTEPEATSETPQVKNIMNYTLPDGWKELTCSQPVRSVFVVPRGASNFDCDSNSLAPIKISIDTANNTDCNQLQNVQNVSKHICISEYINGMKSLKAETIYNKESSYKKDTTINAYYINTGDHVVKLEYTHTTSNEYQSGFDELAKSVTAK